jgi:Ca2+-binding EF-hand superfamily protein
MLFSQVSPRINLMRINIIFGALWCLGSISSSAFPQEAKGKREGFEGKAREMMMRRVGEGGPGMPGAMLANLPIMAALDADKDGALSVSEIANASKALLTLDKNGDGILSTEEMRPSFNPMAGGPRPGEGGAPNGEMMARMFTTQDVNGDGKLTGDEIPDRMRDRVGMIDENGDGALDKSEMQKAMSRMMGGKAGSRPGPGGKDGSGIRPKRPGQDN